MKMANLSNLLLKLLNKVPWRLAAHPTCDLCLGTSQQGFRYVRSNEPCRPSTNLEDGLTRFVKWYRSAAPKPLG